MPSPAAITPAPARTIPTLWLTLVIQYTAMASQPKSAASATTRTAAGTWPRWATAYRATTAARSGSSIGVGFAAACQAARRRSGESARQAASAAYRSCAMRASWVAQLQVTGASVYRCNNRTRSTSGRVRRGLAMMTTGEPFLIMVRRRSARRSGESRARYPSG
jgi:hypothetical protein